ncbi:DUF5689 domain-containing protein [Mucilaginibacter boryungensis]|uniref:DUF5689 domain-containing protein n=1 Tax=Mucilaginibacter boryungensis TaxID=768480 RepID=A0ABR9XG08_9SPHI|nr:DUF5689 domain-containing protein [Mucilaginibacter boryungensis]MBE9666161.1 hypothetical protein [Mucilaginibacter boryungensis]
MKKILFYSLLLIASAGIWSGCQKGNNYPDGVLSPIIAITDLRQIYKGTDVTLDTKNMAGAHEIIGTVVSDFTGGNMRPGLLVMQNNRRTRLRGIAINLGADAAKYAPGDSLMVDVTGAVLTRSSGVLQLTGLSTANITKVSSGNTVIGTRATSAAILANPDNYESTLVAVVKGGFDPLPAPTETFSGDKVINDGFGNINMHTEAAATFASTVLPVSANFTGIIYGTTATDGTIVPQLRMRSGSDVKILSSVISIAPIIICGFYADPPGTDYPYEYVQLLATRDINFATEPFSVVFTNNAGASTPTGFPTKGWATGDLRTFKFELKTGSVTKGQYFYTGGSGKRIAGSTSADISSSTWIGAFNYQTTNSPNFSTATPATFGTKTTNLLANSGNAAGIAVLPGLNITLASVPVDVIFYGTGGTLFDPVANVGYPITNTDLYDLKDVISLTPQPYNRQGSNTLAYILPLANSWDMLGGVYNVSLGKWVAARSTTNILPVALADIEGDGATKLK